MLQPHLSLDQWTIVGVLNAGTEDKWPSECRPLNVPKKRSLKEGEEGEDETETETSGQRLLPSGQTEPTLGEDLWPSNERSLDVRERMKKSLKWSLTEAKDLWPVVMTNKYQNGA
ncbi:hypothetical protein AXG93_3121s1030 [Marchantia polymorpha subsp. ruderalis]|uniref:Uncharacterized protein n=1 Tax=Marchantia polymorpha subsp. ruderalis TaxID=1480154 RepID=A0A176VL47_MARPO|nr:hypothetical protein AXG93_3121s1030 [Marchantia polymorpha subsp. ruderalis]